MAVMLGQRTCVALAALSGLLLAQSYRYSPSITLATQGGGYSRPWSEPSQRYMQIHTDLRGTVMLIREIAFRGSIYALVASGAQRTIDCEVSMGDSDYATSTQSFASNYLRTPTNVMFRKLVNLPDIGRYVSLPFPFTIAFPFDNVFVSTGVQDLAWDVSIYSNTATSQYPVDSHAHSAWATQVNLGVGCTVTGSVSAMAQRQGFQSIPGPAPMLVMYLAFVFGPSNVPASIMMGTSGSSTPIPGLCTNLFLGSLAAEWSGMSDASGQFAISGATPWNPAFVGLHVYVQSAALEPGSSWPLKIAASDGLDITIAALSSLPPVRRVWGPVYAATGTTDFTIGGVWSPTQLVTRIKN